MSKQPDGIVACAGLPADLRPAVRELAERCNRAEGLDLKLNLAEQRSTEAELPDRFLFYDDGALAGFLSLDGTTEVEVCGMVDPAQRRRGIGSALLKAAAAICLRRGLTTVKLICEDASASGKAFLAPLGTSICDAEYRMRCAVAAWPPPRRPLTVRELAERDIGAAAAIIGAAFGNQPEVVEQHIRVDLRDPSQRFYLGEHEGRPVAALKIFSDPPRAYIYAFGVHPDWRDQGFGMAMLVQTLMLLRDQGAGEVALEVAVDNEVALNLYRRCGFETITQYDYHALSLPTGALAREP